MQGPLPVPGYLSPNLPSNQHLVFHSERTKLYFFIVDCFQVFQLCTVHASLLHSFLAYYGIIEMKLEVPSSETLFCYSCYVDMAMICFRALGLCLQLTSQALCCFYFFSFVQITFIYKKYGVHCFPSPVSGNPYGRSGAECQQKLLHRLYRSKVKKQLHSAGNKTAGDFIHSENMDRVSLPRTTSL